MAARCEHYTFDECVAKHGLDNLAFDGGNTTEIDIDAALLCEMKNTVAAEYISAAAAAIAIYLITNVYIQIAECFVLLKRSKIWGENKPHEKEGHNAILQSATTMCIIGTILYFVTMFTIRALASPLDNRANSIVVGLSQIFAAVIFLMLSINIPQWFGEYHSSKNTIISFTSAREIRFTLSWNIMKQFMSMYFFTLFFSCADFKLSLVYGVLLGTAIGMIAVFVAMKARSPSCANHKRKLAILVIVLLSFGSWLIFLLGIWYILNVWQADEDYAAGYSLLLSLVWIVVIVAVHLAMKSWTRRGKRMGYSMRFNSEIFNSENLGYMVDIMTTKDKCEGDNDEGNRGADGDADEENDDTKEAATTEVTPAPAAIAIPEGVDVGGKNDKKGNEEGGHDDPLSDKEGQDETVVERHVEFAEDTKESPIEEDTTDNGYVGPEEAPSYWTLFMTKLVDTYPFCCRCCLKKKYSVENISKKRLDYVSEAREKSKLGKFLLGLKRFIWYLLSIVLLFLTIVNIGATQEQCKAKNALPSAWDKLYPSNFTTGTMCAWDEAGPNATIMEFDTLQAVNDANYKVIHCGSCGACSNWNDIQLQYTTRKVLAGITKVCAKKSLNPFIKTNYSDDNDPVVKCNHLQVGFTLPCAKAWAWDEVHTKNSAIFTFLMATYANSFSDMEVTYQDITMATIDEALSGPRFVPWVGATRRRMNIISDIQRPINQQCSVAQENWAEIFLDPFKPPVGGTYTIQSPGKQAEVVVVVGQDSS